MSILRRLERRGADPTLPWGSSFIPTNGMLGFTAAGVPMNDDMALSVSTVYRCIQIRAEAVASLPLRGYKRKTTGRPRPFDDHPLIQKPCPDMPTIVFYCQLMFSLLLRGNFYAQVVDRDARGFATALVPVHPDTVIARRVDGKRTYRFNGVVVPADDVLHIPSTMVAPGGFIGLNPVEYMRQSWALAVAAEKYGGQFFANSANPSGVISVPEDLTPEEAQEMKREWSMLHQGLGNAQYPAVLTGGATWQQMSISPEDAQFLATRQFQRKDIYSWFGIPPSMMGDQDRSTAVAGIEQDQMHFVTNTVRPDLIRVESYISDLLPPPLTVKFDLSARLRADTLQRTQAAQMMRNSGLASGDEIRDTLLDMEPMPAGLGDIILAPVNLAPLGSKPDPTTGPTNDSGFIGGGGDPNSSPDPTAPDALNS